LGVDIFLLSGDAYTAHSQLRSTSGGPSHPSIVTGHARLW